MISAKYPFKINKNQYTVYFGMTSVGIFQQKSFQEVMRMTENGIEATGENVDKIKTFAYVVYSGLCNWADIQDEQRPKYSDVYMLCEDILRDNVEIQEGIWTTWQESQPVKEMLERLNGVVKNTSQKKSTKKVVG